MTVPSYRALSKSGELAVRARQAYDLLSSCRVCPRCCGVDRTLDERGYCRGGLLPKVASFGPHFGEEAPLVGRYGSGTIFFSGCNMRCIFCQNYSISQLDEGAEISCERLAGIMLTLQDRQCHNINLVSPTHFVPQIIEAVSIAADRGLSIPIVYNTGTYDTLESLRLLEGIIDIYMPDAKYGRDEIAAAISDAPGYTGIMKSAIREMQRQAGDLVVRDGIAERGLIIRHLVLPDNLADTELVMAFIANEISEDAYVNIMDQYRPCGRIQAESGHPFRTSLMRGITKKEYLDAIGYAESYGLHRGFGGRPE
ncbi:MAG TPA: radical SAM protein [Methanoregulaceae archaeon]|nr:MAG: radical SAM protein [Methanolinea sp.]HON80811.1 radical SAM protein [Methanoregulaceae archaeon]HPD09546.1 radical SAM protein [Methanoregulaceae archaeon]HRT15217.1 radical SAM protein [Methanoregulaceae archaeon]HRU30788.1 radical SAM protein [Methanoregulaceae archaeon]